ncbi:hypothetical protein [Bartonella bovis]|uniref:Right handed beta helix domain-containing protein n=1 Tax=Bartonella bovis m02 TaxID=1094492 RepID=N6URH5_9HYPH|nr:hypothetical protein [Bartonella bovis]ENN92723.1 hypothetical protein m02_10220 [Bartonella bovis m02]
MTVNGKNDGVVGIKVEDTGTINATVMGLKIERSGTGSGSKGVEFKGKGTGKGTLMLNMVDVSGFATGVSASKGKLEMMGKSRITFASGGTGLEVKGGASAELMRTKIVGSGTGTGVVMESEGVLMLTSVDISDVKMGVSASNGKYGVQMMGEGKVVMMGGSIMGFATGVEATAGTLVMMGGTAITVKENGTGLSVSGKAMATLMGGTIKGDRSGKGKYGVKMESGGKLVMMGEVGISNVGMGVEVKSGTVEMSGVGISNVKKGVYVENGTVMMMGGTITVTSGDSGNSGSGYGVGVGVSGNGTVKMMGTTIMVTSGGTGKGTGVYVGGGVKMGSSETLMMMKEVRISGFEKGVSASNGTVVMNMGSITIKEGAGNGIMGWGCGGRRMPL